MPTVITADRLIDGTGAAAVDDPVLVIEGEKIVGVFQGRAPDGLVAEAATILDFLVQHHARPDRHACPSQSAGRRHHAGGGGA